MRNLSIKTPTHGVKRRRRLSRPRYVSRRYPVIVLRAKICFIFFFTPENTCCIYTIHPMLFQTVKPYPGSPGVPGDAFLPRGAVHVVLTLLARLQDQRSGQDVPTRGGRSGKRARTTNLSPQREQRERESSLSGGRKEFHPASRHSGSGIAGRPSSLPIQCPRFGAGDKNNRLFFHSFAPATNSYRVLK